MAATVMKEQPKGDPIREFLTEKTFETFLIEADTVLMATSDEQVLEATLMVSGKEIVERLERLEAEEKRMSLAHQHIARLKKLTKSAVLGGRVAS